MTATQTWMLVGAIGAGLATLLAVGKAVLGLVRALRKIGHFMDDWFGEPARPGVDARPGVPQRLQQIEHESTSTKDRLDRIEHQLVPNGGSSLRDVVDRVEVAVTDQTEVS